MCCSMCAVCCVLCGVCLPLIDCCLMVSVWRLVAIGCWLRLGELLVYAVCHLPATVDD